jgi:hypothetical protein
VSFARCTWATASKVGEAMFCSYSARSIDNEQKHVIMRG